MSISCGRIPKGLRPFLIRRVRLLLPLLFVPSIALGAIAVGSQPACAQELQSRIGVIVDFSEGEDARSCVDAGVNGDERQTAAPTETLNGLEALTKAEHELVTKDFGGTLGMAVCKIDNVGTDDCNFDAGFWAYYHRGPDGAFQFSDVGPSTYQVPAGGVEAWVWTPAGTEAAPPSPVTLDEICIQSVTELEQTEDEKPNPKLPWILGGAAVVILGGAFLLVRVLGRGS